MLVSLMRVSTHLLQSVTSKRLNRITYCISDISQGLPSNSIEGSWSGDQFEEFIHSPEANNDTTSLFVTHHRCNNDDDDKNNMLDVDVETMAKRSSKPGSKLFDTDLRKDRTPFLDSDLQSWTPGGGLPTLSEKLLLSSQPSDNGIAPRMTRVDSYRAPPLRLTLETIEEDKPDYFQRSKSVPVQRRFSFDAMGGPGQQHQLHRLSLDGTGQGLCRLPSYRPGQCAYGISASGPMTFQANDHVLNPPRRRSRFSKMRDALRCIRLREAFGQFLSKMRLHHQPSRRPA